MVESNVRNRRFKAVNHQHDIFHVSIWQLSIIYTNIDIEFFAISEYKKLKEFYFRFIEICCPYRYNVYFEEIDNIFENEIYFVGKKFRWNYI